MGTTLLFIALGLGIGAVLALLFAPASGEKVRHEITDAVEERFGRRDTGLNFHKLEKEFSDLRKKVEDRLAEMR